MSKPTGEFARGDYVRHLKTGGVYLIETRGFIEKTMAPCYVYRNEAGMCFIRPDSEMLDGRFEIASQRPPHPVAGEVDELKFTAMEVTVIADTLVTYESDYTDGESNVARAVRALKEYANQLKREGGR